MATQDDGIMLTPEQISALLQAEADVHVKVTGLSRIDRKVVDKLISHVVSSATIGDAVREADQAVSQWLAAGLFKRADYSLEPPQEATNRDVVVHFRVEEGRPQRSIGVFTSEAALPEVRVGLSNLFGGKYSIQGTYVPPASKLHSWSLAVSSLVPWLGRSTEYSIGARTEAKTLHPADVERVEEIKATTRTQEGAFEIGFQRRTMAARDSHRIPRELLRDFVTHGKGFLRHEVHVDRTVKHQHPLLFDMYPLPVSGFDVSMISELCGSFLGGTSCFHKWECLGTRYWPVGPFCSLQWSAKLGSVAPLTPNSRVPLNDRLFLSQRHVRGYKSIGPSTFDLFTDAATGEGCRMTRYAPTGGNALAASSLSFNFPFLLFPRNGMVAMHAFVDGGSLRWVRRASELLDVQAWRDSAKASAGFGLVITRLPLIGQIYNGRFELNVSVPLSVGSNGLPGLRATTPDAQLFDTVKFGLTWSSSVSM